MEEEKSRTSKTAAGKSTGSEYWNEKVPVKLFSDGDKYTGSVFVHVGNKSFLIRRGEEVMVPRYVAEVLKDSERQREEAVHNSDKLQSDFERASSAYGISI